MGQRAPGVPARLTLPEFLLIAASFVSGFLGPVAGAATLVAVQIHGGPRVRGGVLWGACAAQACGFSLYLTGFLVGYILVVGGTEPLSWDTIWFLVTQLFGQAGATLLVLGGANRLVRSPRHWALWAAVCLLVLPVLVSVTTTGYLYTEWVGIEVGLVSLGVLACTMMLPGAHGSWNRSSVIRAIVRA